MADLLGSPAERDFYRRIADMQTRIADLERWLQRPFETAGTGYEADDADALFVNVAGDTMTGDLVIPDDGLFFGTTTRQMLNLFGSTYALGVQSSTMYHRTAANFAWYLGGVHNGTAYAPGSGGTELLRLSDAEFKYKGSAILTAATLPDPTITLGGDLTGSVTLTDLGSGTLNATIAANAVALGADTTGNYVATITGTTNQVNVAGSGSESAGVTLSLPQNIHSGAAPGFAGVTLAGTAQSDTFASLTTGWAVSQAGGADFRQVYVDQLKAKQFLVDQTAAYAGSLVIAKSASTLTRTFTTPSPVGTVTTVLNESFETGSLPVSFTQTDVSTGPSGTVSILTATSPDGSKHIQYTTDTSATNKYARAQKTVAWTDGVIYQTRFWLNIPTGTLASCQGPLQIVGHDPFPQLNNHSRLMYDQTSGTWRIYYKTDGVDVDLTANPGFTIPENQWVWIVIEQRLSSTGSGYTKVWLDGTLVGSGTGANLYNTGGNGITRMRYGIVATAGLTQTSALAIKMDKIELYVLSAPSTIIDTTFAPVLHVRDLTGAPNMQVFQNGDTVVLRNIDRTGGTISINDVVGTVASYADGPNAGEQQYTFTRLAGSAGGAGAGGTVFAVDSAVIDYGTTGFGVLDMSTLDGVYSANSPYLDVRTWTTAPTSPNFVSQLRLGRLNGLTANSTEYGLVSGVWANRTTTGVLRSSTVGLELYNAALKLYSSGTETVRLDPAVPSFAMGATLPTGVATNTGIWMGKAAGVYQFRVGDPAGDQMLWDGDELSLTGAVTVKSLNVLNSDGDENVMTLDFEVDPGLTEEARLTFVSHSGLGWSGGQLGWTAFADDFLHAVTLEGPYKSGIGDTPPEINLTAVRDTPSGYHYSSVNLYTGSKSGDPGQAILDLIADNGSTSAVVAADLMTINGDVTITGRLWTTAWTAVTFQNSWSNYGGGYAAAKYQKIGHLVRIQGVIGGGTIGTVAFTLPSGFRPAAKEIRGTVSGGAFGYFEIDTTGTLTIQLGTGPGSWTDITCCFSIV